MENVVFRREQDSGDEPTTGTLKKINDRKRKDMTPFISFFSEREKSKLIKKLFKRDANQFNMFMTQLNAKLTWHDAYEMIDSEFKKRKADIFSEEARNFTDRIYKVFFPEDI